MNSATVELAERLEKHLQEVEDDPSVLLDERLFDESIIFLAPSLIYQLQENMQWISRLSSLSPKLQQDPTPLIRLLEKLVGPFSFSDVLALEPPVDFISGLSNAALPYNGLMLRLVEKAAETPKELAALANMPDLVEALVQLWLSTVDTGVANDSASVLLRLLRADRESVDVAMHGIGDAVSGGQGLLWRRIFGDKDIYSLLFSIPGSHNNRKEKTLAQARLMSFAPALGNLDWSYLTRSHHPDIERQYGLDPGHEGLLDFLAIYMVDYKADVLIHMNLMQFYEDLIKSIKIPSPKKNRSVSLEYLEKHGLHDRTISYWLTPNDPRHDPVDLSFLNGPSAHYIATFASYCPDAFVEEASKLGVLPRLSRGLSISANQWAQGQSPKHDLSVLVSLPRVSLLPQVQLGAGRQSSPALLVPCKNTDADALNSLGWMFQGPPLSETPAQTSTAETPLSEEPKSPLFTSWTDSNEAAAARALFSLYLAYHDDFFTDITDHASIVALPDKAMAAINVISSIANATWAPLPAENSFSETEPPRSTASLPSEEKLSSLRPQNSRTPQPLAATGIEALLQNPASLSVFPFLLRPAQTFTHLVGGQGDPESNAYKVAMRKWDCIHHVRRKLAELVGRGEGGEQAKMLRQAIDKRIQEGPWGAQSQAGGHVASLEL